MYAYLIGEVKDLSEDNVVLEVNHIGYNIRISARVAAQLPSLDHEVMLYTYTYVKEDALQLYGFLLKDEITLFKMLLQVSGIGPKGALSVLSVFDADSLRLAILSSDVKTIAKAPGIGRKTAERLILDLKDKVSLEEIGFMSQETAAQSQGTMSPAKQEAVEALTALGYSASDALRAVKSTGLVQDEDTETILKAALKKL